MRFHLTARLAQLGASILTSRYLCMLRAEILHRRRLVDLLKKIMSSTSCQIFKVLQKWNVSRTEK